MSIFEVLQATGLPAAYGFFRQKQEPPFVVYIGAGQNQMAADDTVYWSENDYQVEYYFTEKNEAAETAIEESLLSGGYLYQKSMDTYIDSEAMWVIYYDVSKR